MRSSTEQAKYVKVGKKQEVPSKVLKSAIAQKSAMQFSRRRMFRVCVCVKQGCRIFLFDQKRNMRPLENCISDFCAMADLSTLLGSLPEP